MESPVDLASTLESVHLSDSPDPDADPALKPTTIAALPNETLNRILELVAEPIALRAKWDVARAAADTLLAASLVDRRWQDVAGRIVEQNCCILLPITPAQLDSYTSRTRLPATHMILQARHKDSLFGATRGLALFRGVKSLRIQSQFLPVLIREESVSFHDLRDLTLGEKTIEDVDFDGDPTIRRLLPLSYLSFEPTTSKWAGLLLQSAKSTLVDLEIWPYILNSYFVPRCDYDEVRNVTIVMASKEPPRWDSQSLFDHSEGVAGLARFPSVRSLKLHLCPASEQKFTAEPVLWNLSSEMFDQTIGTLPPSARLSQLSLPTGKLSTLNNITSFLNKPVLHELKEFLFPNISRTLLDQRGFGRELLAACDARGIRVVFQEELALLRSVM